MWCDLLSFAITSGSWYLGSDVKGLYVLWAAVGCEEKYMSSFGAWNGSSGRLSDERSNTASFGLAFLLDRLNSGADEEKERTSLTPLSEFGLKYGSSGSEDKSKGVGDRCGNIAS